MESGVWFDDPSESLPIQDASVHMYQGKLTRLFYIRDLGINRNKYIKACVSNHSLPRYMDLYVLLLSEAYR